MVRATAISPYVKGALAGGPAGHIEAVFTTSFNIELGGRLVHVGGDDDLFSCVGMSVPRAELTKILEVARPRNVVIPRGDNLRLYTRAGIVAIDISGAEIRDCSAPVAGRDTASWSLDRLRPLPLADLVGLPLDVETVESLKTLTNPSAQADEVKAAITRLIGRGPGLTPSGDDVLLGWALALRSCGSDAVPANRIAARSYGKTTDVSIAYAEALCAGWVNPVYADLLRAGSARDAAAFDRAVGLIRTIGHTSGCDGLMGLALGFSYVTARAASPIHSQGFAKPTASPICSLNL